MSDILKHLPNVLTVIRIFLTPICVYFLISQYNPLYAFIFFSIASITDAFDGYYARKYNATSRLGAFLDPLADKIMVVSIFFCFFYMYNHIVDIYVLLMIVFRDVLVTFIRMIMEYKGHTMTTSNISKIKTALQIIAINLMFVAIIFKLEKLYPYSNILYLLIFITALITFYTGVHYLTSNYKKIKSLFAIK